MNTIKYKLRAECLQDVLTLMRVCPIGSYTIDCKRIPDVEFTFTCLESIEFIKEHLRRKPDLHVMLETVQPIEKYTGERVRL